MDEPQEGVVQIPAELLIAQMQNRLLELEQELVVTRARLSMEVADGRPTAGDREEDMG